ncbi:MAG: nuclear transport factor 2 family protein [Solirubrobacteraceae bacterium]
MQSWLAKKLISYTMSRARAGDIRPTLLMDAEDVTFRFPGDNSWSGEYHGKAELRRWLERMVRVGVKTFPDEVVLKGFPWRHTVCVRGHDYVRSPAGETVYENRFVIWGRLRWGRLEDYEVYEDTEKATALDEYLLEHEPALASA